MAGPQTEELDRRHVEDSSSGRQTKTRGGAELDSSTTLNTSDEASAFPPAASIAVRIYLCIYLLISVVEKSLFAPLRTYVCSVDSIQRRYDMCV